MAARADHDGEDRGRPVVLHVLEAICGGTARHLVDLVEHARGAHHVVAVPQTRDGFFTDAHAVAQMKAAGADVRLIDMRRLPVHPRNLAAVARLTRLQREVGADVIHGHSGVGGALARALPGRQPRVYTPNGLHPARAALAVERILARRTAAMVAVSASEGELMRTAGLAHPHQLVVIPNGVNPAERPTDIDLHAELGLPAGTPLVGTIARLDAQKAPQHTVDVYARVAAAVPDVHFVVIGDGALAADVDAAAAVGPLAGRFHRIAGLPGAAGALPSLRVFTLLSAYEGGPYAPLEAARAGVPLVLSDVVGNRDVVVHGESGELVALGDVDAAAAAVLRLLDDGPRRAAMVGAMHARLHEIFTLAANGAAHDRLYRDLADGTARDEGPLLPYPPEQVPRPTTRVKS